MDGLIELLRKARPEQLDAITSDAPITVVSAGAGTGKTETLAHRIVWLLATDPGLSIDKILVLTYTKKAATEMKSRIKGMIERWRDLSIASDDQIERALDETISARSDLRARVLSGAARRGDADSARARLQAALDGMDEAYISTIHSFAFRVMREAGIDVDVDQMTKIVSHPFEVSFWRSLEWMLKTGANEMICSMIDEDLRESAMQILSSEEAGDLIAEMGAESIVACTSAAASVFGSMNATPEYLTRFLDDDGSLVAQECRCVIRHGLIGRFERLMDAGLSDILSKVAEKNDSVATFMRRWAEVGREDDEDIFLMEDFLSNTFKGTMKGLKPYKEELDSLLGTTVGDYKDNKFKFKKKYVPLIERLRADHFLDDDEISRRRTLHDLARICWSAWESAKARASSVTFDDMVRLATSVIDASPSFADQFSHIVVDEFQDTDGTQDAMIRGLAGSLDRSSGRTLFIVGDIKQSIYSFRKADPSLFAGYIASPASAKIPLQCSFRMRSGLMERVNEIFASIWRKGVISDAESLPGGVSPKYEELKAPLDNAAWAAGEIASAKEPLELIIWSNELAKKDETLREKNKAEFCTAALARALADRLLEIRGEDLAVKDGIRPMDWGDIAVLVKSRNGKFEALREAFKERGIPAVFSNSKDFFNRCEVRDAVNMLRALSAPEDDEAVLGWASSPISMVDIDVADELIDRVVDDRDAAKAERKYRRRAIEILRELDEGAFARFEKFRKTAELIAPSEAMLLLVEDDRWIGAFDESERTRVIENVDRCVEMLLEYEAEFGRSLEAEVAYLSNEMITAEHEESDELPPDDGGAVTVMTIHASKGLEFPVVAIFGMDGSHSRSRKNDKPFRVSPTLGLTPAKRSDGSDAICRSVIDEMKKIKGDDELERLLYVAMTRAKHRLICVGRAKSEEGGDESWIDAILAQNAECGRHYPIREVTSSIPEIIAPQKKEAPEERKTQPAPASASPIVPSIARLSASAYAMLSWCPVAYRLRYRQGLEMRWGRRSGDGYGGADLGSLAHWFLQSWDLTEESAVSFFIPRDEESEEQIKRSLPFASIRVAYANRRERRALCDWLCSFALSERAREIKKLRKSGLLRREVSFSVPIGPTVAVGSIDVYWEDDAGSHIFDWKTTIETDASREIYDAQLNFYAAAVAALGRPMPIETALIDLRPTSADESRRVIEDARDIIDDVARAAATAVGEVFAPRRDRCGSCPWSSWCLTDRAKS